MAEISPAPHRPEGAGPLRFEVRPVSPSCLRPSAGAMSCSRPVVPLRWRVLFFASSPLEVEVHRSEVTMPVANTTVSLQVRVDSLNGTCRSHVTAPKGGDCHRRLAIGPAPAGELCEGPA